MEDSLVLEEAIEVTNHLLTPKKSIAVDNDYNIHDVCVNLLERSIAIWYTDYHPNPTVSLNEVNDEDQSHSPDNAPGWNTCGWHPIHLATLIEHHASIQHILSIDNAAVNAQYRFNLDTITPLNCAAFKGSLFLMTLLENQGGVFSQAVKDMEWAIKGKNTACFLFVVSKANFDRHLSCRIDVFQLFAIGALADDAAPILETVLNFSSTSGRDGKRVSTFKRIVVANTVDIDSRRLLFLVLEKGYKEVLKVLLKSRCCSPNDHTEKGEPAMQYTIRNNFKDEVAVEVLDILLNNGASVNKRNAEGKTALNLAASAGMAKCAFALIQREASISVGDMKNLNERVPNFLKNHLDGLISSKGMTSSPTGELVSIDIRFLGVKDCKKWRQEGMLNNQEDYRELGFLKFVIDDGQTDLLMHPVIQTYLYTKWLFFRKFFYCSALAYILQLICYTYYIGLAYDERLDNFTNGEKLNNSDASVSHNKRTANETVILSLLIIAVCSLICTRTASIFNSIMLGLFKAQILQHALEAILVVSILITIVPQQATYPPFQRAVASISILLAWCNSLFLLARHPELGIYVEMLGKVFANFATFFLTYTCFLIGYANAFWVLLPRSKCFDSTISSVRVILTWMIGEMPETFEDNKDLSVLTNILYISFILIVTVALINLLIGLAVHDIQGLLQSAKLNKSIRQVRYMHLIESMFYSKAVTNFFPISVKKYLRKSTKLPLGNLIVPIFPNKSDDKRLPHELKQEALAITKKRAA